MLGLRGCNTVFQILVPHHDARPNEQCQDNQRDNAIDNIVTNLGKDKGQRLLRGDAILNQKLGSTQRVHLRTLHRVGNKEAQGVEVLIARHDKGQLLGGAHGVGHIAVFLEVENRGV